MGILYWKVLEEPTMIRIAIVVCCAALAAAEAEADPALFYSSYGHQGLYQPGYSTYRFPTPVRSYSAPLTSSYSAPLTSSYSAHYGFPAYQARFAAPATVGAHQPYGYAASGRYLANSVGAVHIAKREAEAEPEAEAEADPAAFYNSFYNNGYNMAYSPYKYPTVYSRSYYQPSYNNFGYRSFYGKREAEAEPKAEAEADPAVFYNSLGHQAFYNSGYNMAYNPYNYPTVYSRSYYQPSYNNFGYRSFYGKREAEAEAEPAVVYGQNGLYNTAYNTYTTGFPAMRSYAAPVSSYPGYSLGSFYSGYRNFYQPSYYGGYGHY